MAIGDYDGDGDLDAVVANTTLAHQVEEHLQLLINDGYGNFEAVDIGDPRRTEEIVAADLDATAISTSSPAIPLFVMRLTLSNLPILTPIRC